jgi:hypothetical protein
MIALVGPHSVWFFEMVHIPNIGKSINCEPMKLHELWPTKISHSNFLVVRGRYTKEVQLVHPRRVGDTTCKNKAFVLSKDSFNEFMFKKRE